MAKMLDCLYALLAGLIFRSSNSHTGTVFYFSFLYLIRLEDQLTQQRTYEECKIWLMH